MKDLSLHGPVVGLAETGEAVPNLSQQECGLAWGVQQVVAV